MIKNERQYEITRTQARKFRQVLEQLQEPSGQRARSPWLLKVQTDALKSQLEELEDELRNYEKLRRSKLDVAALEKFETLPEALIASRIAAGLTQKQLAALIGVKEQQIQRYEATEYQSASVARVREVATALRDSVTTRKAKHAAARAPHAVSPRKVK